MVTTSTRSCGLSTGKELITFKGHTNIVWSVAISPDGKRLATGSFDSTVKIWETATGKELMTLNWPVSWNLDVALSGSHQTARYWPLKVATQ